MLNWKCMLFSYCAANLLIYNNIYSSFIDAFGTNDGTAAVLEVTRALLSRDHIKLSKKIFVSQGLWKTCTYILAYTLTPYFLTSRNLLYVASRHICITYLCGTSLWFVISSLYTLLFRVDRYGNFYNFLTF